MKQVLGWHCFYEELKLLQAQCLQIARQADALSKAIAEVLPTEEKQNETKLADYT